MQGQGVLRQLGDRERESEAYELPPQNSCSVTAKRSQMMGITYAALALFGKRKSLGKYLPQAETIFEYRFSEASGPVCGREPEGLSQWDLTGEH